MTVYLLCRQGSHDTVSPPTGRKRPIEPTITNQSSDTNKRSKVAKPIPKRVNRIRMPEIEYESDMEHAQCSNPVPDDTGVRDTSQASDVTNGSNTREKSMQMMLVDEEIVKKVNKFVEMCT